MKKTSPIYIAQAATLLLMSALFLTSCEKDTEEVPAVPCTGQPFITQVTTSADRATAIQGASRAEWIIIHGSNFCDLEKITFNTIEVSIADAYVTDNSITVKVPETNPTERTNKLVLFSKTGQAEYDFQLYQPTAPDLEVYAMKNEYVPEGETMTITGKNFYLNVLNRQVSKVLFGTLEASILSTSTDSTLLVKVPEGAQPGAAVKVIGKGSAKVLVPYTLQDVEASLPFPYQDNRHILFDGDTFIGWNPESISSGPQPKPIKDNYLRLTKVTAGNWSWDQLAGTNEMSNLAIPDDAVQYPQAYLLKFEVYNKKPITNAQLRFGIENQYVSYTGFKTVDSEWRTVTIEFSEVIRNPITPQEKYYILIAFTGYDPDDIDISFDNIRIVPKP